MAKPVTIFRQCVLHRRSSSGLLAIRTTYLPEIYAVPRKLINLRDGEKWEKGWRVVTVSQFKIPEKQLPYIKGEIRSLRDATGDSDPVLRDVQE